MTHAEPNEDLGFGFTELTTATNNGDLKRAITFLEAIEIFGETSNIGENANEFISVEESGKTERAVRKSEQRLKIYVNKKHKHSLKNEGKSEQDADVDLTHMLDLQVDQNTWNRDVDTSLGHDNETLLKHSMKHATQLIMERIPFGVLQPCRKYGTQADETDSVIETCGVEN